MRASQLLVQQHPANPCTDHLILLEHPRAGWRGVAATNCARLALKPPANDGSRSAVVGDAITIGGLGLRPPRRRLAGSACWTHASLLD
eukprot:SAG25_NODE_323_length_9809_cov_4.314212_2_plen_88_part_00